MPLVLERAHALERDRAADVDVRRGDVDAELHAQRPAERELALELALGQHVDGVPGQLRPGPRDESSEPALKSTGSAAPQEVPGATARAVAGSGSSACSTLLGLVGLFCFASFAYGFVVGDPRRHPAARPGPPGEEAAARRDHLRRRPAHASSRGCVGSESRKIVPSSEIAPVMKQAIVAIEDKRFFEHRGVDVRGIVRAVWQDVRNKKVVQGGSTITQQFVKNAYLTSKRSIARKLQGGGARVAARAGVVEGQDPHRVPEHDLLRQRRVRDRARGAGLLRARRGEADARRRRRCSPASRPTRAALQPGHRPAGGARSAGARCCRRCSTSKTSPTTSSASRTERRCRSPRTSTIPALRGPRAVLRRTTSSSSSSTSTGRGRVFGGGLQRARRRSTSGCRSSRARRSRSGCTARTGRPRRSSRSTRGTGAVLAMVGGQNYRESQFNLAVQGERQPGSSFKPFVLATALEQGIAPATTFESKPVTISLGDRNWYVRNYEGSNLGWIDLDGGDDLLGQHGLRAAHAHRRAEERRRRGDKLGITSTLEAVLLDRARRRGGQPARDGPRVRGVRERREARRRLDLRKPAARRPPVERSASNAPSSRQVIEPDERRDRHAHPAGGRPVRHGQARCAARTGRSPARPARPRTTATRGSSATRRNSSSPSGSAIRTRCGRC